jgi:threonine/homoserine/homoserine lactone efflux protein
MGLNFDQRSIRLSIVFRQGLMTNVLNPKCALFFLAFPPQFVDADAPSRVLASLFLGLLFDFNGTLWNLFVAWLSARAGTAVRKRHVLRCWIDRALGSLFIDLGITLAAAEHSWTPMGHLRALRRPDDEGRLGCGSRKTK